MSTITALPTDIDGVIERLEVIIQDCIARQDRLGYFAALYNRVTQSVKEGIAKGEFDDGARMERLDVIFANRYIAAYDQYRSGELPSAAWFRALNAAQSEGHIVLQHLLAGMNAHINLDLGIAAARTASGSELPGLKGDFDRINSVLASLTPVVEQELDHTSPVFDRLSSLAPKLELKLVGFSMQKARDAAWAFAAELAPLRHLPQVARMAARDAEASLVAAAVLNDGLIVRMIRDRESKDVAHNIQVLAAGEFRNTVPAVIGVAP
ncbi:MAG TPA: DUF5995 family protein [Longimicrobiaceae bacterium]|nr:DUF5995 family protein [Longimicrobiaceae bacterium]